jgi:hypothetical protein
MNRLKGNTRATDPCAGMRDMTVLRQIAAHLDGWSDLRTRVTTDDLDWPGVHVSRGGAGSGAQVWRCVHDRWTGHLLDDGTGEPLATIQTSIGEDASASEVADGIKAVYRMLRTEQERG